MSVVLGTENKSLRKASATINVGVKEIPKEYDRKRDM